MSSRAEPLDEATIRREAAHRAAAESIARARAGEETLEETLNDCLYHAERRAGAHPPEDAERQVLDEVRAAMQSRDPARLEAAAYALCEHYAAEIGGDFDPRVFALAA